MKLLLINPLNQYRKGFSLSWTNVYPPIALGILASLTPKHWDIEIIDENFDKFENLDEKRKEADLVGITSFSPNAPRAYEIASYFRERNIPVVYGGNHATMMAQEAADYVDVVFKGEAETKWHEVIEDFENNRLKPLYDGGQPNLKEMPPARHDLFHNNYIFSSIQTTRGCPFKCDFCSVHVFNGTRHRLRPANDILDELESISHKLVFIVDDNFYGYSTASKNHAYEIMEGMLERGIKKDWYAQTSMNVADDEKFLKLAAKSGCKELFIGVETDDPEQLKSTNKRYNAKVAPENFRKKFKKIQKHGIAVLGAFIFGLDGDTKEALYRRAKFIEKVGVDTIQTSLLMTPPGTDLFDRMKKAGRMLRTNFPKDWERYHSAEVILQPENMSPEELQHHMYIIWHKLYNKAAIRKRFLKTLWRTKSFKAALWAYIGNTHYRSMVFENGGYNPDKHPDKQERIFLEPVTHKKMERPDNIY
ncbi:MAG: B12-binding domain-containing radical SAM protein [Bacteroidales bacterium]|nr:B12-binding domain-containing radical SAM protein [Bacteroidales bacterium]MCF8333604.1 B12-binding domain-containing radical SAM protein [Bacteroidales bacterium]